MFQLIDGFADGVVAVRGVGWITADDDWSVLGPQIMRASAGGRRVRVYLEFGDGFEGNEASAILTETGLSLEELGTFERIAVVTDTDWLRAVLILGPLIPGEIREFALVETQGAREWISAPPD